MGTSDRYSSYTIEERNGELCAVFKRKVPLLYPNGDLFNDISITPERTLVLDIFFWGRRGRDITMLEEALSDLRSAKAKPPTPHV